MRHRCAAKGTSVRAFQTLVLTVLTVTGGAAAQAQEAARGGLEQVIASSFRARGQAGLDRLEQTPMQVACSVAHPDHLPAEVQQRIEREALQGVQFPQDGRWLGNWQAGEKIAQSGTGLQYSDPPDAPRGGNCYGCHRLSGTEIAFGTIGPSLVRYRQRYASDSDAMRRTWIRLWNVHAFNACSVMPRFGDAGILTAEQIRDVMALLFDPASPVNR
jgi:sulfur-oxidizing protein SoxX